MGILDIFGPSAFNRLLNPQQMGGGANPFVSQNQPNMLNAAAMPVEQAPQQMPPQMMAPQSAPAPQMAAPQAPQQPSGFGGIDKQALNDFFTGLAAGATPEQSFALAAAGLSQGKSERNNVNQTVDWLKGRGMDDQTARQLASSKPALSEYLKSTLKAPETLKPIEINGQLVDPKTYQVIGDFRTPQASSSEKDTPFIRELIAAGLTPGTPAFQEAILAKNKPKGMSLETNPDGTTRLVMGGDGLPPKLNESEGKNTGFLIRARDSNDVITKLEDQGTSLWNNTAGQLPVVGNFLRGDDAQKFDQAKRDFINAQLRQESGAVISPEEFKNAEVQYFPQPGDSPAVIAQKRENRQNAISGFQIRSGVGAQSADRLKRSEPKVIDGYTIEEIQ